MSSTTTDTLTFVAKLRWTKKNPEETMNVPNFEAVRLMCHAIMNEQQGKVQEAEAFEMKALRELEIEQRDYLRGIKHVPECEPAFSLLPADGGNY